MKPLATALVTSLLVAGCVAPVFQGDDDDAPSSGGATAGTGGAGAAGAAGKASGGTSPAGSGGTTTAGQAGAPGGQGGQSGGAAGQASGSGGAAAGAGGSSAGAGGKAAGAGGIAAGAGGNAAGAGGNAAGAAGMAGAAGQGGTQSTLPFRLAAGHHHTCGLFGSGEVQCWGANDKQQVASDTGETCDVELGPSGPEPVSCVRSPLARGAPSGATLIAAGDGHTCASTAAEVFCWGDDADGQLGDGMAGGSRGDAVAVVGLGPVVGLGAGSVSSCALDASGIVSCWGGGSSGQLGHGVKKSSATPVQVMLGGTATELAVGGYHACALLDNNTVSCWGLNLYGQLGDGTKVDSATPKVVAGLMNVASIAAGGWHSCARHFSGDVSCWGSNSEGQMGSGPTGSFTGSLVPTAVPGVMGADELFAGRERTCVSVAGDVSCWGSNAHGELGVGNESSGTTSVSPVKNLSNLFRLALGGSHACAVGGAKLARSCWGWNAFGQLGTGTTVDSSSP